MCWCIRYNINRESGVLIVDNSGSYDAILQRLVGSVINLETWSLVVACCLIGIGTNPTQIYNPNCVLFLPRRLNVWGFVCISAIFMFDTKPTNFFLVLTAKLIAYPCYSYCIRMIKYMTLTNAREFCSTLRRTRGSVDHFCISDSSFRPLRSLTVPGILHQYVIWVNFLRQLQAQLHFLWHECFFFTGIGLSASDSLLSVQSIGLRSNKTLSTFTVYIAIIKVCFILLTVPINLDKNDSILKPANLPENQDDMYAKAVISLDALSILELYIVSITLSYLTYSSRLEVRRIAAV